MNTMKWKTLLNIEIQALNYYLSHRHHGLLRLRTTQVHIANVKVTGNQLSSPP